MKRRVLLAVLPVLAAVALAVAIAGNITHGGSGSVRGHPVLAGHGVKVSIASMQAHQRRVDRRTGTGPIKELRLKPDPVEQAEAKGEAEGSGEEQGSDEEDGSGEEEQPAEGEHAGVEPAAGEAAGSGGPDVGEKPAPGEPEMRPKDSAPSARQLRTGRAALVPNSSFSENTSFLGVQASESGFVPPDSMGAVGPDQVVVDVNGRIKVFDKQGNLIALDVTDDTFWDSVRNGSEPTDPGVEFDRLAGRWIISAINTQSQNNRVMVAVSSGPEINNLSSFTFFSFNQNTPIPANNGQFADYPQLGVDSQAVYIGVNGFSGNTYAGSSVYVIKKSTLLAGGPLQVTGFRVANSTGPGPSSPQPATDMDSTVPAGYVVGADNAVFSRLDIRRITNPGGTPSISGNLQVTVPPTSLPLNVPAQGTHSTLDALDDRLFEAMIARDPDGTDTLWTAHNISVSASGVGTGNQTLGNRDADRWYQIGDLSGTPTVTPPTGQSGTLFDTTPSTPQFFWMPSIAMNGQGHASLNSSSAGLGRRAEVVASGRLSTDPVGATQSPDTVQSSSSPYDIPLDTANKRWGDYSQTVVDPNDNQTFWTFQEYANASNSWAVRVIQLKAPPPATPSGASPSTVESGSCSEQVDITGTTTGGSGFFDPGSGFSDHITASVTGGVVVRGVDYTDPTHITLNLDTTGASSGAQDVTVTNPDGQSDTATGLVTVGSPVAGSITPCPTGTVPPSPKNENNPAIVGVADPGSTVNVYTDPSCTGTSVGTDSAANFASPGITVDPVADDSTTTYYVQSTDGVTPSACSSTLPGTSGFVDYVEDSTSPVPSINLGPNGPTNDDTPRFAFSATDAVGPVTFECSVDTGTPAYVPCSGPGDSDTSGPLAEGPYTFHVRATDAAGNSATAMRTFTVDVTPPTVQILSGPSGTTTNPRPTFTFTGDDPPLGTPTFECSIDTGSADFGACSGPGNSDTPASPLANGSYAFHVRATDVAGNTATAARLFAVNVPASPPAPPPPASPPDTTITKGPKKKSTKRRPKFKFTSSQAGSSFQCKLDRGTFRPCVSPFKPAKLSFGKHVFSVEAVGPAGNVDPSPAVRKFKVEPK